jgi:hypothetical protein
MWQAVITYGAVLAAAGWVTWKILLPRHLRAKFAKSQAAQAGKCGKDECGCG